MKNLPVIATLAFLISACQGSKPDIESSVIAHGQMPNIANDHSSSLHLVYGNGDNILYSRSSDHGKTFSDPKVLASILKLSVTGPQLAVTANGLVVIACNEEGDIFSFTSDHDGNWTQRARINDTDTSAKENLMSVAADGNNAFAVWLDLRSRNNQVYGAKSTDGGITWSKNFLVYASPDATVCECCKPSVAIKGTNVYVMFRNWLNGNRDMHIVQSNNGGESFGQAQKLGTGSWAYDFCPVDGGAITIDKNGEPITVWRRENTVYSCEPGKPEKVIAKGKGCTMESVNGKNVFAWLEGGNVIIREPTGVTHNLGKGKSPMIKALNNEHIICVFENEKKIRAAVLEL